MASTTTTARTATKSLRVKVIRGRDLSVRALLGRALAAGACGLPSADEAITHVAPVPRPTAARTAAGHRSGGQDGAADREAGTECAGGSPLLDDFEGKPVEAKWETRDDSGGDLVWPVRARRGGGLAVNLRDRDGTKVTANLGRPS